MAGDTLTITDNRTGKQYEVPISYGTYPGYGASIPAIDLRNIRVNEDDFGLLSYDPAFMNTASCSSAVSFIDGEKGILQYRGYPIEQLAENSTYPEVAYLLLFGELPTASQLAVWNAMLFEHSPVVENIKKFMDGFWHDAHPMGIFACTVGAFSTFYPEAKNVKDPENRHLQIARLIGKVPTIAAFSYRHSLSHEYIYPDSSLSYAGDFLKMMFAHFNWSNYKPDPVIEKAMDVLFILHADHEQNCSATAMRVVGSSLPDPYVSVASAASALYGPLHGGANEQVLVMLREIGSVGNVANYVKRAKSGKNRLMGFGHRVYKNYDPRARIIKKMFDQVFEVTGSNPLLDIAIELERIALEDDYFVKRKLYPNVDFYSGLIYEAMGLPTDIFTVLFAIPRTSGWLAQWQEMLEDPDQKIARPRQIYTGEEKRDYVPIDLRG
jgi:citrate synthase